MSVLVPGISLVALGLAVWILAKRERIAGKLVWFVAAGLMILGIAICVCMFLDKASWCYALIGVPFGLPICLFCLSSMKDCVDCSCKTEGIFLKAELHHSNHGTIYNCLVFSYAIDSKKQKNETEDYYHPEVIERRYQPNCSYTIHYNPKNSKQIRAKRFHGIIIAVSGFLFGILIIYTGISLI